MPPRRSFVLALAGSAFLTLSFDAGSSAGGRPWRAESNQEHSGFGNDVGTAGDVNGDGYADVIVGADSYNHGQISEGRAFVYLGSSSGPSVTADWTAESDQRRALFGDAVGTARDVNGDGFDEVIVGAPWYHLGQPKEGRAFVYYGSEDGPSVTRDWSAESNAERASFGTSVGTAGDVNGDGYADVIVGAPAFDDGQGSEAGGGRAYVYHGSADGLGSVPAWTADSDQTDAAFGVSVAAAGDVNGDGYDDVIVGAFVYSNRQRDEGRAFVYLGSAEGLSEIPAWTAESDQAFAYFGASVGTAGDVNADGYADVIVGAFFYDHGQENEGGAFVYHGSPDGPSSTPDWAAESDQEDAWFGDEVGTASDVNADGYADVIVGAPIFGNDQTGEGRGFVYHGSADGLSAVPAWTGEGDQDYAFFGTSVGAAGDVNGDGYAEVIVGATGFANPEYNEGAAFVYRGRRD